ncbi:MAG: RND family transporter [Candidatus Binatia bacterium]
MSERAGHLVALGRFIVRNRVLLLVIGALWFAIASYLTSHFKLHDEPGAWAPPNHPLVQRTKEIEREFGGSNHLVIMVRPREGDIYNVHTLEKVNTITDAVLKMKGVIPYTVRSVAALSSRYMKFHVTDDGEEVIENRPLMERVPDAGDQQGMERIRWGAENNPLVRGPLVAPDGAATLIEADFRTAPVEDSMGKVLPYTDPVEIYRQVQPLAAQYTDDHDIVEAGGTPIIIGWVNSDGLIYVAGAFIGFVLVLGIVLLMFMRSWAGAVLPIAVGLYASVSGFGIYYLVFGHVLGSAAALLAPFIVVAAGACHAVQYLRRLFDESLPVAKDAGEALVDTFATRFSPMLVSLLADLIAFVVLSFVPFENVAVLGKMTTLGLASVTVAEFFLLTPLLYYAVRNKPTGVLKTAAIGTSKLDRTIERGVRLLVYNRTAQIAVSAVIVVLFAWSLAIMPKLDFAQDNTYAIHNALTRSWEGNEIFNMEMKIRDHFGGVYPLVVLVRTKGDVRINQDIDVLRQMNDFQTAIKQVDGVAGTLALPDYLKVMNRLMRGGTQEAFALPPDERSLGEYIFMYEDNEPGLFDAVLSPKHTAAAIVVQVRDTALDTVTRVIDSATALSNRHLQSAKMEGIIGGGAIAIAQAFNESIGKWLFLGTVLSMGATFILLVIMLRTVMMSVLLMIPLILAIAVWLLIMHLAGVPMDSNTTAALAIASGVGVDSEVYLLYRVREEYAKNPDFREAFIQGFVKIRRALVVSNVALIIGCWALIPTPLYLGSIGFGMGLILLICFVFSSVAAVFWTLLKPSYLTFFHVPEETAEAAPARAHAS